MAQQQGQVQTIKSLIKFKKYAAVIQLSGLESFATNDIIATKLRAHGFTNVIVEGSASNRTATGVWSKENQSITEMPKQIVSIKEI